MKIDLINKFFENIIDSIGANLMRFNFRGSKFYNVNISEMNLYGTSLFNYKRTNLRMHEDKGMSERITKI